MNVVLGDVKMGAVIEIRNEANLGLDIIEQNTLNIRCLISVYMQGGE